MEAKNFKLEKIGNLAIINDDMVVDMSEVSFISSFNRQNYANADSIEFTFRFKGGRNHECIYQMIGKEEVIPTGEDSLHHLHRELVNFKKQLAKLADLAEQKTLALAQLNKEELQNQPIDTKPLQRFFLVGYHGMKYIGLHLAHNSGILGIEAKRMMSINEIKNYINSSQAADPSYQYTIVSFTEVEENDYNVFFERKK